MHFLAKVEVRYKKSVLEPQGEAIRLALNDKFSDIEFSKSINMPMEELENSIENIRVGKLIEIKIQAKSNEIAKKIIEKITNDLLHNPVMEVAHIELIKTE